MFMLSPTQAINNKINKRHGSLRSSDASKYKKCQLRGNYCWTCTDCVYSYEADTLTCHCLMLNGHYGNATSIPADCPTNIRNSNGKLICMENEYEYPYFRYEYA